VLISGHDGGTGASPLSSIFRQRHPLGDRPRRDPADAAAQRPALAHLVQTDGQLKTGRDVAIAAMLGADEMGFSTAPLIATGCIMMRACHLNTCPVGIATQDPELRKRFAGTPEHVINFFHFVAEEVREILASLGCARWTSSSAAPTCSRHRTRSSTGRRAGSTSRRCSRGAADAAGHAAAARARPGAVLDDALDWSLIDDAREVIEHGGRDQPRAPVLNVNRCVGGLLSSAIARATAPAGLEEDSIVVDFRGSAGQSFGAWLAPGVTSRSTARPTTTPARGSPAAPSSCARRHDAGYLAEENVIVGNTVLYGATSGQAFFRGLAGERFAVRNSGACAVVEGVGDHGCEYMTGGRVVVLGPTGRNFAAGMSGGIAYVLDEVGDFATRAATWASGRLRGDRRGRRDRAARAVESSILRAPARRSPSACWPTGRRAARSASSR
jgi:glutamate synthase domain-containing protein 3